MIAAEGKLFRERLDGAKTLVLAAILGSIPFWLGITDSFLSDDWGILSQAGRMIAEGPAAWFRTPVDGWYRPLFLAMMAGMRSTFGLNAAAFHLFILALYLLVAVIAGALAWRLSGRLRVGLLASFLFALHPVHAEALLWIASSNEILAAFFVLAALWAHERYARLTLSAGRPRARAFAWFLVAILALVAGLMSKEVALFAAAIPLVHWLSFGRRSPRLLPGVFIFAAGGIAFLLFRLGTGSPYGPNSSLLHILQNGAYYMAVELFALPDNLGYPSSLEQWFSMAVLAIVAVALASAGWWILWRRRAAFRTGPVDFPIFALLWSLLALGPVALTATGRTAFLSSIGVCWCLAWAVDRLLCEAEGLVEDEGGGAVVYGHPTIASRPIHGGGSRGTRAGWLVLACFSVAFAISAGYRALAWRTAGVETATIVDALERLQAELPAGEPICIIGLSDHYHHAYTFRNAFPALSELRFGGRVVAQVWRDEATPAYQWLNDATSTCEGATLLRVSDGRVEVWGP